MMQKNDDLTANYVGAFDGRLSFGKRPALLIVDFVVAYLDPASRHQTSIFARTANI